MILNKPKMIEDLKRKIELGTDSDLYMCPDSAPEFTAYTIAALVLTDELKEVPAKVLELVQKSIEHDLLMNQATKQSKKSLFQKLKGILKW